MTKITKIKTKLVKGNVSAHDFGKSMDYLIVKIDTDENITGIAILPELFQFSQSESLTTVVKPLIENILGNIIIGKDPTSIEAIWEELFIKTTRWGRRGLILQAISTIDVALWDILGKLSNKPIWRLLGGYREVVPTYANTAYQLSPDELANKAKELVSKGFKAVKIRGTLTAVTPEEATERIKKVREAIGPDIKLMVDLNGSYSTELALKMLQRWERYDLYWVEEPVHPDNLEGYKKIKKSTDIKIAAIQILKYGGAYVVTAGRKPEKLQIALNLGSDAIIDTNEDYISKARALTPLGKGFDAVIDLAGSSIEVLRSIKTLKRGGLFIMIGYSAEQLNLDYSKIVLDGIKIFGSRSYTRKDLKDSLKLISEGKVKPLITERFGLYDINKAISLVKEGKSVGRIIIRLDKSN